MVRRFTARRRAIVMFSSAIFFKVLGIEIVLWKVCLVEQPERTF